MFIGYPVYIHKTVEEEVDAPVEEKKEEEPKPEEDENKVEEASDEEKAEPKKADKIKQKKDVVERVNSKEAIWTRDPKDVTEDEYKEFYKQVNPNDWEGHLAVSHFRVDGAA